MEYLEELRFLGIKRVNLEDFLDLVLRLLLNPLVVYWISKKIYLKNNHSTSFHFGYTTIALVTFLLCFLLSSIKLDLGFALGLFAIFTIIRFRTVEYIHQQDVKIENPLSFNILSVNYTYTIKSKK